MSFFWLEIFSLYQGHVVKPGSAENVTQNGGTRNAGTPNPAR